MYQKIRCIEPAVEIIVALWLEVKSMNDKMNLEGLVPSLPVFGTISRFPVIDSQLPNQTERMR